MSDQSRPPAPLHASPPSPQGHTRTYTTLPNDHPAKIGFRTYVLALSLSLGPALLPFATKAVAIVKGGNDVMTREAAVAGLGRLLRQELGPFGSAFAITTAVAGGSFLQNVLENSVISPHKSPQSSHVKSGAITGGLDPTRSAKSRFWCYWMSLSDLQRSFLANALASTVAIILLQWKAAPGRLRGVLEFPIPTEDIPRSKGISPTLNLTLVLFVRALDSIVHGGLQGKPLQGSKGKEREVTSRSTEPEEATSRDPVHVGSCINKWTPTLDSLIFCVCSARCDQSSSYGSPR